MNTPLEEIRKELSRPCKHEVGEFRHFMPVGVFIRPWCPFKATLGSEYCMPHTLMRTATGSDLLVAKMEETREIGFGLMARGQSFWEHNEQGRPYLPDWFNYIRN